MYVPHLYIKVETGEYQDVAGRFADDDRQHSPAVRFKCYNKSMPQAKLSNCTKMHRPQQILAAKQLEEHVVCLCVTIVHGPHPAPAFLAQWASGGPVSGRSGRTWTTGRHDR